METATIKNKPGKGVTGLKLLGVVLVLFVAVMALSENNPISELMKERKAWRKAMKENTYDSWAGYLQTYSSGKRADEALIKQEETVWKAAVKGRNLSKIDFYMRLYTEGHFKNEAISLRDSVIWDSLDGIGSFLSYNAYLGTYPSGQFREQAGSKLQLLREKNNFRDPRDNQTYRTVKIGEQVWMAQNLNFKSDTGSWCYENNPENGTIYGRLYNWETASKVCPAGWHLPTEEEWVKLSEILGGGYNAGGKLKEKGYTHWNLPNNSATNESGFEALPAGYQLSMNALIGENNTVFNGLGTSGGWWSGFGPNNDWAYHWDVYSNSPYLRKVVDRKYLGVSVRCVKDQ